LLQTVGDRQPRSRTYIVPMSSAGAGGATAEVPTPHGPARITRRDADGPARGLLMLGHGAGGGVSAPDLLGAAGVAVALGVHVVLMEQPYRVAGRRAPAPAAQLDAAWLAVVEQIRDD